MRIYFACLGAVILAAMLAILLITVFAASLDEGERSAREYFGVVEAVVCSKESGTTPICAVAVDGRLFLLECSASDCEVLAVSKAGE